MARQRGILAHFWPGSTFLEHHFRRFKWKTTQLLCGTLKCSKDTRKSALGLLILSSRYLFIQAKKPVETGWHLFWIYRLKQTSSGVWSIPTKGLCSISFPNGSILLLIWFSKKTLTKSTPCSFRLYFPLCVFPWTLPFRFLSTRKSSETFLSITNIPKNSCCPSSFSSCFISLN